MGLPDIFLPLLATKKIWTDMLAYMLPQTRYVYWTPKGLRGRVDLDSCDPLDNFLFCVRGREGKYGHDKVSYLSHRTSPFITLWCVNFEPLCAKHEFMELARRLVQTEDRKDAPESYVRLCASVEHVRELLRPNRLIEAKRLQC